jgi:hypothetical protein
MNDDQASQGGYAKIVVAVFTALLIAAIGQGVVAWRDIAVVAHSVQELRDTYITDAATLAAIAQQAHANSIHRVEHEKQAERWIDKILENERRIQRIETNTSARPDPFTGTEGRALRYRIEKLEHQD